MKILFTIISILGLAALPFFYMTHPGLSWQWVWLGLYAVVQFFFILMYDRIHSERSLIRAGISLALALAWVYSSHTHAFSSMGPVMWLVTFLTLWVFAQSFYCLIYWLEQPFAKNLNPTAWWWGILYGLLPALVWCVYFFAYFPGKMTYDSFWQWDMAHHIMPYNAWHPVLHTWLIQATTWLADTPASYTAIQIILVSAIVGYALYSLQSLGVPLIWVILIDLFYAFDPVNGFYTITMWKDIPFAAFVLLLTVLLARILFSNGEWLERPAHMIALILIAFVTMCLRDNGVEVVLAALVLFIAFVRGTRVRMAFVLIPVVVLYFLFSGPLMNAFHVIKNPLNQALAVPSQQIAATYKKQGHFTPKLKNYFDRILPAQDWAKDYKPYTANPIKLDRNYHASVINDSFSAYLENWAKLLELNPVIFVKAYLKQMAVIWEFHKTPRIKPYFTTGDDLQHYGLATKLHVHLPGAHTKSEQLKKAYQHYVQRTRYASPKLAIMPYQQYKKAVSHALSPLKTKSLLPGVKPVLNRVYRGIQHGGFKNYFLKGAIPGLLLLFVLVAAIRREGWRMIGMFLPVGFVIITVAMAMPAPDYRYLFDFIFTVPFLFLAGKLEVD